MEQYQNLLKTILTSKYTGHKPNRTGVDTLSLSGHQEKFDLQEGFPLVTTKKVHTKSVFHELIWLLSGNTNIKYMQDNNITIWDEWADSEGNLGPVYGFQWRSWPTYDGGHIDQLQNAVNTIKTNPNNRRLIVSAWNPAQIDEMALPPCHLLYQFFGSRRNGEDFLDMQLYQRSCDSFLGVPFNIASYALLLHIVANETQRKPGLFVHSYGDAHIYCGGEKLGGFYGENLDEIKKMISGVNKREDYLEVKLQIEDMQKKKNIERDGADHVPFCLEQLAREPRPLPTLEIKPGVTINTIKYEDIILTGYNPHPTIKAKVAV